MGTGKRESASRGERIETRPRYNEWDTGNTYDGRITVIGIGGDPHDPHAEHESYRVVRHYDDAGDVVLEEFEDLDEARKFGREMSEEINNDYYNRKDRKK